MTGDVEVYVQVPKRGPEHVKTLILAVTFEEKSPLLSLVFTSVEGLVVTSNGNFFRSAWERMGVVFCRENMMMRLFAYLGTFKLTLFGSPLCLGQWANKKENLDHSSPIFNGETKRYTNTKPSANYSVQYD